MQTITIMGTTYKATKPAIHNITRAQAQGADEAWLASSYVPQMLRSGLLREVR